MLQCCEFPQNNSNLISKVKNCKTHGFPIHQICRQKICVSKALICSKCERSHHHHHRQPITAFFNEQYKNYSYRKSTQIYTQTFIQAQKNIKKEIQNLQTAATQKLNSLAQSIDLKFKQLLKDGKLFPQKSDRSHEEFEFINNETMENILKDIQENKFKEWVVSLEEDFRPFLQTMHLKIINYLTQFENIVHNSEWSNQEKRHYLIKTILSKKFPQLDQLWPTKFSTSNKHHQIETSKNGLEATYQGKTENFATILLNRKLSKELETKISLQITNFQKSSFFSFAPNVIGIGVCNRDGLKRTNFQIKQFQFSGVYGLMSDSKTSKSRDFIQKNPYQKYFCFQEKDIIDVSIDYDSNQLVLRKKSDSDERAYIPLPNLKFHEVYPVIYFKSPNPITISILSVKSQSQQAYSSKKKVDLSAKKHNKQESGQINLY